MTNIFEELLKEEKIPAFAPVRYELPRGNIGDAAGAVDRTLDDRGVLERVRAGQRIAITGSSREISNMPIILRQLAKRIQERGARPFVVPAMGSHGGATAEGQRAILEGYGITEETIGCPILSSMETVPIGTSAGGLDVHMDRYAQEADGVVVVGRIKPHTDFHGRVESGLMKMMAIGLGKQHGAFICHRYGFGAMEKNVCEFATVMLEKANILFGLGIVEDNFHQTHTVAAIPAERIPAEEPALLDVAKSLVPIIPFEKVDVLVVQEIGKNISGSGMDPNVIGRSGVLGITKPFIESIAILDITDKSHHNGCGVGLGEVTTQRAYEKIRFEMTYPNGITACEANNMKIPTVMPNDELAIRFAIRMATGRVDALGTRIVWIENTTSMRRFYVSEALLQEAETIAALTVTGEAETVPFDEEGNVHLFPPNAAEEE